MATVGSNKYFAYKLKDMPVVQDAVEASAREIAAKAEANLVAHRQTGNAKIVVEHGRTDWYVTLQDRPGNNRMAAWAIEYGHYNHLTDSWTQGIYVLTRAAGFM